MNKKIVVMFISLGFIKGSFGMDDGRTTPFDEIANASPHELTTSQTLNAILTNPAAVTSEEPKASFRSVRRTSAVLDRVGDKFDNEVELKSGFPKDRELLLKRRATFLYDLYFSNSVGPECFVAQEDGEKIILTYKHEIAMNFYGFKSFDSKEEFVFCLKVLAQKAKRSSHIDKVNALLDKFK